MNKAKNHIKNINRSESIIGLAEMIQESPGESTLEKIHHILQSILQQDKVATKDKAAIKTILGVETLDMMVLGKSGQLIVKYKIKPQTHKGFSASPINKN